ncbi:MAG: site-specific integrase [Treponema sp.]|nr:site-specific integrase [Treponema sp.]
MPRLPKPYSTPRRADSKTFQITLNPSCGLPARTCREWKRRSFQDLPEELAHHRSPRTKAAACAAALALIAFLGKAQEQGAARRVKFADVSVGEWVEQFTKMETSPRTGINASQNRPYSPDTLSNYRSYFDNHIKGDEFCALRIAEAEEEDALAFVTRLSAKSLSNGRPMGGSRTFAGVVIFMRMAFEDYQRKNRRWLNPFKYLGKPKTKSVRRGFLPEDEMLRLFEPGVLGSTMELAVCAAMFLSGLRRAEIFALKPECLDWSAPKITVKNAWQDFDRKTRRLGPPKGKKERDAPFDPVLQAAIRRLWEENGRHEFVFSLKDGSTPGPSWIYGNFRRWLARAGIELGVRKIVPHSSRHSLASLLEKRNVSLRYIQDLLGHCSMETTKIYLHSTDKTIGDVGRRISEALEKGGRAGEDEGQRGG